MHFFWAAFPLSLLILLLQVMPALAQRGAVKTDRSIDTWTAGANLPNTLVRAVGVFFPANGKFYAIGGRTSDAGGSEETNPSEYTPSTNSWAIKAAVYPDQHVNNMACGVLTVGGTPQIYCIV